MEDLVGRFVTTLSAEIVLLFGALQCYGIRKMQRRTASESA